MKTIEAGVLQVAYLEQGPTDGPVVVLLHGFPYDVHAYDEVVQRLAQAGCRCIIPWLRGYGPTRFTAPEIPRSGEQAALGADLLALLDALKIERAVLAGYDWGGLCCGRAVAGAGDRAGQRRPRLQHPGHRQSQYPGIPGS